MICYKRYRNSDSVPLSPCDRGIGEYVTSDEISAISSEVELILPRASTFTFPRNISTQTVSVAYRSSLGVGQRRGANQSRVPAGLAKYTNKTVAGYGGGVGIVVRALAFHQCSPGSISALGVIRGLSLLVLYSAMTGFPPGTLVFLSYQKPTFHLI